jgi:hypothetical protein
MVEITCPHCDEGIELGGDVFGLFDCPHCDEEFTWKNDFDKESVSNEGITNPDRNRWVEVGLGILLVAVIVWPVIPALFGIDDWDVLVWMFAAFVILSIGIVILFVGLWGSNRTLERII